MLSGLLGVLLVLGPPTSDPPPPELPTLPTLPTLPRTPGGESRPSADEADEPEEETVLPAWLILDLYPRRTRAFIHRGKLHVETAVESEELVLEPGVYRLDVMRGTRMTRVKQTFALSPGETVHLELRTNRRVLLAVIGGVIGSAGLAMTLSGGIRASRRGSSSGPSWDTQSGVLFGVGLGTTLASLFPIAFAASPRVRACRRSPEPSAEFEQCRG